MELKNSEKRQVKITSKVTDAEGQVTELIQLTEATYKRTEGKAFLLYTEGEISGMEETKTLLSYDGQILSIKRYGEVNTTFLIEPDQSHESTYHTPYGNFFMTTTGGPISWQDDDRLEIFMDYDLQFESDAGYSQVSVSIIEAED
ncbi:MAG: hypothetical protein PWQ12_1082 [Clostridiales bacterium]|jgi:uncharacterized beta-barrel protein YwiB (DUF1934 family)|nr:hypothetical protein [Clostridiales bacterium]